MPGPVLDPGIGVAAAVRSAAPVPIVAVEVTPVAVPFRKPVATAAGPWMTRRSWLLAVRDADGVVGTGEVAPGPADEAAADVVISEMAGRVAGVTPAGLLDQAAPSPLARAVWSGIEAALLDLAATRAGLPLAAFLAAATGARPPRATVAVSALVVARDAAGAAADAARAVAAGYRTVKLKVGGERDAAACVARVAAVRDAVGPDVELRLDANGAWSVGDAIERLRAVATCRIAYVEQPVAAAVDLAAVRAASPVPLAADESVTGVAAVAALLAAGAADALVAKPSRVGGALPTLRIAALGDAAGVAVVLSTMFETGVGLAASTHLAAVLHGTDVAHGIATGDLLATDLLAVPLRPSGGRLAVPTGPGLGVRLDAAAVARHQVARDEGR